MADHDAALDELIANLKRAKMGLPEVGWERVVWGGLGLDEDEPVR